MKDENIRQILITVYKEQGIEINKEKEKYILTITPDLSITKTKARSLSKAINSALKKQNPSSKKGKEKIEDDEVPVEKTKKEKFITNLAGKISHLKKKIKKVSSPEKTVEKKKSDKAKYFQKSFSVQNIRKQLTTEETTIVSEKPKTSPASSPRSSTKKLTRSTSLYGNTFFKRDERRLSMNSLATDSIDNHLKLLKNLIDYKNQYGEAFSYGIFIHLFRIFQLTKNLSVHSIYSYFTTDDKKSNQLRNSLAYREYEKSELIKIARLIIQTPEAGTLDHEAFLKKLETSSAPINDDAKSYLENLRKKQKALKKLVETCPNFKLFKTHLTKDEDFLWLSLGTLTSLLFTYKKLTENHKPNDYFSEELTGLLDKCYSEIRNPIAHQTSINFTQEKKLNFLSNALWKLANKFDKQFEEELLTTPTHMLGSNYSSV